MRRGDTTTLGTEHFIRQRTARRGQSTSYNNQCVVGTERARSTKPLAAGKHTITVDTTIADPGSPADVLPLVDGEEVGKVNVKRTVSTAFTASESLDVGADRGSTVSNAYFDRRPFEFSGKIGRVKVRLK